MPLHPAQPARRLRPRTPERGRVEACALLEALLLSFLVRLLGARDAQHWLQAILPLLHAAPVRDGSQNDDPDAVDPELLWLIRHRYVFGPGHNRGMRRHARIAPAAPHASARAPPGLRASL